MESRREIEELISAARAVVGRFAIGERFTAATVGAALRSRSGRIYTGVCFDIACGIGFCAEHAAVAEMLKSRETEVEAIVAMDANRVVAPCGRCRELLAQIDTRNLRTRVVLGPDRVVPLSELLPEHWLRAGPHPSEERSAPRVGPRASP
jgi:cytidine deaminase